MVEVKLEKIWKERLLHEFEKPYMKALKVFLCQAKQEGNRIYPKGSEYFRALNLTPFNKVKVVLLGQDPYHGSGQAHGLSFSVKPGVDIPPSLANIYKELNNDLSIAPAKHGFLEHWAKQGVLLLNSVLTVEHGRAASHRERGWEMFTDVIIRELNQHREHLVFLLWGSYAQKKGAFIDMEKHYVIQSPHPSPLSAYRGFFSSSPFSKTNQYLVMQGISPVDWKLPQKITAGEAII